MHGKRLTRRASVALVSCLCCVACSTLQIPVWDAPSSPSATPGTAPGSTAAAELSLPDGVLLPAGVALVGAPPRPVRRGSYVEWKATYALGSASEAAVLDMVERSVSALGFSVQRGPHDAFATRCLAGRCELVIARPTASGSGSTTRREVLVLYASRPA